MWKTLSRKSRTFQSKYVIDPQSFELNDEYDDGEYDDHKYDDDDAAAAAPNVCYLFDRGKEVKATYERAKGYLEAFLAGTKLEPLGSPDYAQAQ